MSITDAFGYLPNEYYNDSYKENHANMTPQTFFLVMNAASVILSPLIGVIRIIYSIGKLLGTLSDKQRILFKGQVLRGCGELVFLGPVFALIDIFSTGYRAWNNQS